MCYHVTYFDITAICSPPKRQHSYLIENFILFLAYLTQLNYGQLHAF